MVWRSCKVFDRCRCELTGTRLRPAPRAPLRHKRGQARFVRCAAPPTQKGPGSLCPMRRSRHKRGQARFVRCGTKVHKRGQARFVRCAAPQHKRGQARFVRCAEHLQIEPYKSSLAPFVRCRHCRCHAKPTHATHAEGQVAWGMVAGPHSRCDQPAHENTMLIAQRMRAESGAPRAWGRRTYPGPPARARHWQAARREQQAPQRQSPRALRASRALCRTGRTPSLPADYRSRNALSRTAITGLSR
jgi:hypothetical protein